MSDVDSYSTPCIVYIGGMDSSGGAGLTANVKTTAAFPMLHAANVVTAVTNQTFTKCIESQRMDPFFVGRQLQTVLDNQNVRAIVSEMVYDAEITTECCQVLEKFRRENEQVLLIVNPVMDAEEQGELFLRRDAMSAIVRLSKLADLVVMDTAQADRLLEHCGHEHRIRSLDDLSHAAEVIQSELDLSFCVLKGDLMETEREPTVLDVITSRDTKGVLEVPGRPIDSVCKHGDQDTFDAALACYLVRDFNGVVNSRNIVDCCQKARKFVDSSIKHGFLTKMDGQESGTVNPLWEMAFRDRGFPSGA